MKSDDWKKFILSSQQCERCESKHLCQSTSAIELYWREGKEYEGMIVYDVPVLKCKACGHLHVSNATLCTLKELYLSGEREVRFELDRHEDSQEGLSSDERWVEENYYYSLSAIACGFQARSLKYEEPIKTTEIPMEVMNG